MAYVKGDNGRFKIKFLDDENNLIGEIGTTNIQKVQEQLGDGFVTRFIEELGLDYNPERVRVAVILDFYDV